MGVPGLRAMEDGTPKTEGCYDVKTWCGLVVVGILLGGCSQAGAGDLFWGYYGYVPKRVIVVKPAKRLPDPPGAARRLEVGRQWDDVPDWYVKLAPYGSKHAREFFDWHERWNLPGSSE